MCGQSEESNEISLNCLVVTECLIALLSQEEICMIKSSSGRGTFSAKRYEKSIADNFIHIIQTIKT